MCDVFEKGTTLEGGAKGLRGLFVREPSDKERKKVLRVATATARILELVAGSDTQISTEERRLVSMTMASFGLSAEELAHTRAQGPAAPGQLEVPADIDVRMRRALLRGAWQLALSGKLEPVESDVLHAIAAHLELSADAEEIRKGVVERLWRHGEMAALAIDLVRAPAQHVARETVRPWLDHLVDSCVPVTRRAELGAQVVSTAPAQVDMLPRVDGDRRRQAFALAYATLIAPDPSLSTSMTLRAELMASASVINSTDEALAAFAAVDHFLVERARDLLRAVPEIPVAAAQSPAGESATPTAFDTGNKG